MKKQTSHKIKAEATHSQDLLDREKELKDLVNLSAQEMGFLLGVLQGELLNFRNATTNEPALKAARNTTERILLLARGLKVFSHSNPVVAETNDLSQILLDSIDLVEKEIQDKGINLTVLAEAGSYSRVDASVFTTVFTNLALFSAHALPPKSEIHVSLKHTKNEIRIEFQDNASALSEGTQEHLFNPHALRAQFPTLANLCLAPSVAKFALENYGGKFEVFPSSLGTNFTLSLPFESSQLTSLPYMQKRRAKRIQAHLTCEMTGNLDFVGEATVSVLSILGAFIKLPKAKLKELPELHKEISFKLHLFGENSFEVKRAKIMNLNPSEDFYGLGLEFIELEPKGKVFLEEIIRCNIA